VVDRHFTEPRLAGLYDAFCAWEQRDDGELGFYLARVMGTERVLDVGCGTGELLRLAREAGHRGRLCGLDPAAAMLDRARRRADIEWVLGDLDTVTWDREFDLVVMTGHAFQVFLEDAELRTALGAIHDALVPGGRFAFETRHPKARAWEGWTPDCAEESFGPDGAVVRMAHAVDAVERDRVRFTTTYTSPVWHGSERSRSTLRFLAPDDLASFLTGAGLEIVEQFGDWDRSPLTDTSPEIITVARRSGGHRGVDLAGHHRAEETGVDMERLTGDV
jgi:SAM-dependent methyltransferase